MYAAKTYNQGDIVRPVSDALFTKEGLFKVERICQSWYMYKGGVQDDKVGWKNDNPKLCHAVSLSDGERYECTVNYFIKFEEEKK